jgi:hypothetical protein
MAALRSLSAGGVARLPMDRRLCVFVYSTEKRFGISILAFFVFQNKEKALAGGDRTRAKSARLLRDQ